MLRDFSSISADELSGRYDLCVAGTGPAGMTIAREVAARGGRVLLLEGGALQPTVESREVYRGMSNGMVDYDRYGWIQGCRLRQFGGTSQHWAGRCALLDPIDFEQRDLFGMPGWPLGRDAVYSRLDEARSILDLGDQSLDGPIETAWRDPRFRIGGYAMSAPTRFGDKYREEVEASDRIDCFYNANVTDMQLSDNGDRVEAVTVTGYSGEELEVGADRFVVAFGAMENARFLLNCNSQMPDGIGNRSDWVGRCFMEHFQLDLGSLVLLDDGFWSAFMADGKSAPLLPSFDLMRERNIGNGTISISPSEDTEFYGRLAPIRKAQRDFVCSVDAVELMVKRRDSSVTCPGDAFTGTLMEHLPNRESRITLDPTETDRFGKPRLVLSYNLRDDDLRTIETTAIELGKALASQNVARMRLHEEIMQGTSRVGAHCHHMGTTRMAARPGDGVVDTDCRVHGVSNLFIGGASVFPTGGGVNPTLTLVCLALRTADVIADEIAAGR